MQIAEYTLQERSSAPFDLGIYGRVDVGIPMGVGTSIENGWSTISFMFRLLSSSASPENGWSTISFMFRLLSSSASPSWLAEHQLDSIGSIARKERLRNQVRSYANPQQRPDAIAPNPDAVKDALAFIDLIPTAATLPNVALADDGEVNFYWRQDGLFIDIGFVGDSKIHYYICADAPGVDVDASVDFARNSLPPDVKAAIPGLAE